MRIRAHASTRLISVKYSSSMTRAVSREAQSDRIRPNAMALGIWAVRAGGEDFLVLVTAGPAASSSRTVGTAESLTRMPSSLGGRRLLRMASHVCRCCTCLLYSQVTVHPVWCQPSLTPTRYNLLADAKYQRSGSPPVRCTRSARHRPQEGYRDYPDLIVVATRNGKRPD